MRAGIIIFSKAVAGLGTSAYATHQVCMNIQALSFMTGQAFAVSATSLVGQSLGKRREDMAQAYCHKTRSVGFVSAIILMLIFIYYFKNILSISDIQTLLGPIAEKYFKSMTEKDMTYIYQEVFSMEQTQIRYLEKDLMRRFKSAGEVFEDADPEDREFLHQFSFICLLSFDVYMKKMIIENMIDHMNSSKGEGTSKKEK